MFAFSQVMLITLLIKIAEDDSHNNNNKRNNDIRHCACNPCGVFWKLRYPYKIEIEREKCHYEHPIDNLLRIIEGKVLTPPFFKEIYNAHLCCPFIKSKYHKDSRNKFFQEPAYDKTANHDDNHDNDISRKDSCEAFIEIQEHIFEKLFHGGNLY